MICDMIRSEGMSRPEGTAMQTKPGTDMISDMIRPEGMSHPEGTAIQTKPGTDMICDMIRPEVTSRPVGTAIQTKPGTELRAMPSTRACVPSLPTATERKVLKNTHK
jgi:hypothetical protein